MAEITIGRVLNAATDSVTVQQAAASNPWLVSNPLVPASYDDIELGYTGADMTSVVYKLGGVTVVTLSLTYVGGVLTRVAKV